MKHLILILSIIFSLSGCSKENDPIDCITTIISNEQYLNSTSDTFDFKDISIKDGCLNISVNYGGGCGEVSAILVDSGDILESNPAQRKLRLLFTDNDECEALKKMDFYFDINNLKIDDDNKVLLNFENTDLTVLYEY